MTTSTLRLLSDLLADDGQLAAALGMAAATPPVQATTRGAAWSYQRPLSTHPLLLDLERPDLSLRLADHFPLVRPQCKEPAARFFFCFTEASAQRPGETAFV